MGQTRSRKAAVRLTQMAAEADVTARGSAWKITGPLIRSMIRHAAAGQLDALEKHIEDG